MHCNKRIYHETYFCLVWQYVSWESIFERIESIQDFKLAIEGELLTHKFHKISKQLVQEIGNTSASNKVFYFFKYIKKLMIHSKLSRGSRIHVYLTYQ